MIPSRPWGDCYLETFGSLLSPLEEQSFTGRIVEVQRFLDWLVARSTNPSLLNVVGPGGVGKTTLLRAFARHARRMGRPVIFIDGHDLEPTPADFLSALSTATIDPAPTRSRPPVSTADEVTAYLNEVRPLLLIDTFEELGPIGRYLRDDLLPRLSSEVRIVIAGRYGLARSWGSTWAQLIQEVPLGPLTRDEARLYLERRGIVDQQLVQQIIHVAAGQPLALSLAADLALRRGALDFAAAPEWQVAVSGLVERLLRDVVDADLRTALEAASVVRQVDEATLLAMAGRPLDQSTFARLAQLSFVRPAERGLALHDDIRRVLSSDLRWRDRPRFDELRRRALAHYRERMRAAPEDELHWLIGERLFLWDDTFNQTMLFNAEELGQAWAEMAVPEDWPDVIRLWEHWLTVTMPAEGRIPSDHQDLSTDQATFEALLACPGAKITLARNLDGAVVAFGIILPICQASLPALPPDCLIARVVRAYLDWSDPIALPEQPDDASVWYCATIALRGEHPRVESGTLIRWCLGFFARGGTFLSATADPLFRQVVDTFGFEHLPQLTTHPWGDEYGLDVVALDLAPGDVDGWMDAVTNGRPPPRRPRLREVENELRALLPHWHDDARMAASVLGSLLRDEGGRPIGPRPAAMRQAIVRALARRRDHALPDEALACRALELAYLHPTGTREGAARELAVSRSTFYRLLERGLKYLSAALRT
jgi:hypothetical protein